MIIYNRIYIEIKWESSAVKRRGPFNEQYNKQPRGDKKGKKI